MRAYMVCIEMHMTLFCIRNCDHPLFFNFVVLIYPDGAAVYPLVAPAVSTTPETAFFSPHPLHHS